MDLFDLNFNNALKPLSERMRPQKLDDFIGQQHIVGVNSIVRRAIAVDKLGSCVFYGPPGTGKTTLAGIIAEATNAGFEKLNAISSGVADAKRIIEAASNKLKMYGKKTYLLLDECHRWSKAQSDSVLNAIENGTIIFIGSTTENPYASMTNAIISRCRIFEFAKLQSQDILIGLRRAISDKTNGLGNFCLDISDEALSHIAWASAGDMRVALNALELAVLTTTPNINGGIVVNKEVAEQSIQKKALSIDETLYYDILSAFCKSLRGSDSDAALYWSERLISAGCDPMLLARRLVVHAAEDVGLAAPEALSVATSAMYALEKIGLPEARIPLAQAIIYIAEAPKSNSVVKALHSASVAATIVKDDEVPYYLRSSSYKSTKPEGYKYPHDFGGYVEQQYLPDSLKDSEFYIPSNNGKEEGMIKKKNMKKIIIN